MNNIIRDQTKDLHDKVEQLPFTVAMIEGRHEPFHRSAWLISQFYAFKVLDDHVPVSLKRAMIFKNDIIKLPLSAPALSAIGYSQYLSKLKNPNPHIYLNYMALLFGGQILKKHYPDSASMYSFDEPLADLKDYIRSNYVEDSPEYISEVRLGFQYQIEITNELGRRYAYND